MRIIAPVGSRRFAAFAAFASLSVAAGAHDFERTQVTLTFARDGAFVLEIANDAVWLAHRLRPFGGPFSDRVVLFVDGREVRPTSDEYTPGDPIVVHRLRGRVDPRARTLRWYYGLPIDPYPLTIRRADGRIVVEEIAGDAWSRPIDLSGQFQAPRVTATTAGAAIGGLLLIPIALRVRSALRRR